MHTHRDRERHREGGRERERMWESKGEGEIKKGDRFVDIIFDFLVDTSSCIIGNTTNLPPFGLRPFLLSPLHLFIYIYI